MSDYERCKLQQFVDIVSAGGIPRASMLDEVAEIIGRRLMFSRDHPDLTVASMDLIRLAKSFGLKKVPRPAFSLPILQEIFSMEKQKARRRVKQ